jgi:hypothetical protein
MKRGNTMISMSALTEEMKQHLLQDSALMGEAFARRRQKAALKQMVDMGEITVEQSDQIVGIEGDPHNVHEANEAI